MPIDLQGLCRKMVRPGGMQVWRGSGVRAVPCCSLQRLLQAAVSRLLQADIQGVIKACVEGAQSCSVCQVGRDCCRRGCRCPWQDHHQRVPGQEAGEKGATSTSKHFISLGNVWESGPLCEGNLGQPSRPVTDDQQQPGEPALTSFHFHCKCINSSES